MWSEVEVIIIFIEILIKNKSKLNFETNEAKQLSGYSTFQNFRASGISVSIIWMTIRQTNSLFFINKYNRKWWLLNITFILK